MPESEQRKVVASRLIEAREFTGFSIADVGKALGCEPSVIERIEGGEVTISGVQLRRLSRLYRRPVPWLLGEPSAWQPSPELLAELDRVNACDHDRQVVMDFAEWLSTAGPPAKPVRERTIR